MRGYPRVGSWFLIKYGGPQGSLHKKGQMHTKSCTLYKQKRLLKIKNDVAANKKELLQIKKVAANKKSWCK